MIILETRSSKSRRDVGNDNGMWDISNSGHVVTGRQREHRHAARVIWPLHIYVCNACDIEVRPYVQVRAESVRTAMAVERQGSN